MSELSEIDLANARDLLDRVEATFPRYRKIIESLPAGDPEARLTKAWLLKWEMLRSAINRKADIDYNELTEEIAELNASLPGLSSTRPPFQQGNVVTALRESYLANGYAVDEVNTVMEKACEPQMGAARRDRAEAIERKLSRQCDCTWKENRIRK